MIAENSDHAQALPRCQRQQAVMLEIISILLTNTRDPINSLLGHSRPWVLVVESRTRSVCTYIKHDLARRSSLFYN